MKQIQGPLYLTHFGLSEAPFRLTPDVGCFYSGAERGELLHALLYALVHGDGIIMVTGEVGTGKTTLSRKLMAAANARLAFIYISNPSIGRDELLIAMAEELGLGALAGLPSGSLSQRVQRRLIELHARGRQIVLLVDEAHEMPEQTLQEVRLISNLETSVHKLLQIVLFGQPELDAVMMRPGLRPLRERISNRIVLMPLTDAEIARYLNFRLMRAGARRTLFDEEALSLICIYSKGLARRINILAEKCLLAAYVDCSPQVAARHVRQALPEVAFQFGLAAEELPTASDDGPEVPAPAPVAASRGLWRRLRERALGA
ncbi:MAG: AAA family ATPase [Burkholderiaceae bacterium]